MKLTTLYPAYFPSMIWWQKAYAADVIVILDDQDYPRLGHLNRCWIKTVEGKIPLSVPVRSSKRDQRLIYQQGIDLTKNWNRTHQASLMSNYQHAPYYEFYYPYIGDYFGYFLCDTVTTRKDYI